MRPSTTVRELVDNPTISPLLEDLLGDPGLTRDGLPSFRIDHICELTIATPTALTQ